MTAGLVSCGGGGDEAMPMLPMEAGEWRRGTLERPAAAEAPETARKLGVREWVRTTYVRDGLTVKVAAFAFGAEASAFEAQQKWANGGGTMSFYRGRYLAEVRAPALAMTDALAFSGELEREWLKPEQR